MVSSAGQNTVSQGTILAIRIPLPPLVEQRKIIEELERRFSIIEEVEAIIEANLKRAERLRQSILKQAFSGTLVPQNLNDEPASVLLKRIKQERSRLESKRSKKSRAKENEKQMRLL